ncbi:sugar kinase [Salinisphaera sp. USBA-960]|uniref:sugar kinase n=1 Tax=Salinisphaera orenii TaxID=856731 RepID=UPI000DBE244C|nr:sugar kinase [Salifodinibacter halophilus]NNC25819.1 sugar kinase [Salifodinibacter halophilus]
MPDVVTCGETMALIHAGGGERLRHAGALQLRIGGAETNTAIALARLGYSSDWLSRVGDDELGQLIVERVRAEGVDVGRVQRGTAPTGLFLRDSGANGQRTFFYRAGSAAAQMSPSTFDLDGVKQARVLHLTGITPALSASCLALVEKLIETARRAGVTVSFDINYRGKLWSADEARRFCERWLAAVDILFVGHEEATALWPETDNETLIERWAMAGPAEVLFKRGGGQSSAVIDGQRFDAPAFEVSVVDTTGAGDAFAGGYLAARLSGHPPAERLRRAQALGAICVTGAGDYENLPTDEELAVFLGEESPLGR